MAQAGPAKDESSDDEPQQFQYKIILLGDGSVGKTSIAERFANDYFATSYKQTVGIDFFIKRLVLPGNVHVTLQIWDIGGQSISSKMIGNYIFGAQAVLLCYDITNYQSFQNLEDWLRLVKHTFRQEARLPHLVLVGNKSDLQHMRTVKADKHTAFAGECDMASAVVSAKTGDNVNTTFTRIAAELAGVALTKPDLEVATHIVRAEVVRHLPGDPENPTITRPDAPKSKDKGCELQ